MTEPEKPAQDGADLPEIGENLTRNEIMDVLADEGYPAGGRKGWLKQVLTRLAIEQRESPNGTRAELVDEITDILNENVPGDPKAEDSL
ncbi:hypothetical protein DSM14862_04168 (plasmid) [Sulfitobacter indolifex]|uniref:Rho termination factor N-terminal domain-containing protein n=1 Tax=Sulfitobacter indolifex HEL-45 TaxID=391624 RepID=A0ABM9X2I7_9RHOB|nr:hypothetical protein [Sulfitobacter indolifex]EDQ03590.1 hypothetical protein OIHEL45_16501 [Sulfitobacter indolifex HEL-45]UOA21328.1 hypothetical protein DSM14862_04168 [Sulfitobacter indolifex]